jgi:hypothetical protein
MAEHEAIVEQFRRRIGAWLVVRASVAAVALWAFLWGTAILALKAYREIDVAPLMWGLAGVPIAIGIAAWLALKKLPDRTALRALLDRRGGCGGLLMAGAECDLADWRVPAVELPSLHWNARRPLTLLAIAAGYVILGLALPGRLDAALTESRLDVRRDAERLSEQVEVLKEERLLDPKRAEELKQKIDEVRAHSAGKDPAKTLEALDHLQDVVTQAAKQGAERSAREAKDLGKVEAGAEAVQQAAPNLDPKQAAALMKELAAMAEKATKEGEKLGEGLDAELAKALKEGKLSSEQFKKLAAAAKLGRGEISKTAQKLFDSRLIDSDQLKECKGGQCDGKGLAEFLKKNGSSSLEQALKNEANQQRGNGGIGDDGPVETPLEFGDKTSDAGAKFKEVALPPSELNKLKESQTSGVSAVAPTRDPKAGPPQSGSLGGAAAGGGSANNATVLPQHNAAVGRYFDRPMK